MEGEKEIENKDEIDIKAENEKLKDATEKNDETGKQQETEQKSEESNRQENNEEIKNEEKKPEPKKKKSSGKRYREKTTKKEKSVEEPEKQENEAQETEPEKEEKKPNKKRKKTIIAIVTIIVLLIAAIFAFLMLRPKFKDASIELGTTEINASNFLVSNMYAKNATIVTDVATLDINKVGEVEIELAYKNRKETVKLSIVDTTAPQAKFKNVVKNLGYEINPEDFIEEKSDLSAMTVEIVEKPEITEYADYNVTVKVKDEYGNETVETCVLTITWLKTEVNIELGDSFEIEDLIFDVEENEDKVPQSEVDKIDTEKIGEYTITVENEGKEYTSIVKVQDTTPPELELKELTIYDDEKISDYKKFIKKVSDASGEPETTLKTEIDYTKTGEQEIIIEATDASGNKIEKTTTLTIKKDTDGPAFSGLTDITVEKNGAIDYYSGVKAVDKKDGTCKVSVDSSSVNTSVAGTYYATYTSQDTKGNKTTKKREITVNHDQDDTNAKLDEFYNNYCAGKDPVGIASAVREHISYNSNWGEDDPVWYGLTQGKGNCYVHARTLQKLLEKAGYTNKIIYLEDQSHYWNLVYVNGVWRHLDGTPSVNHTLGLLTDEQKLADPGVHQKTWDRTNPEWPPAI